jgi:1-acyl-sn-glycerol-3-phosphate acyltransferase
MALPSALIVFPWTWITGDKRLLFRAGFGITGAGLRMAGIRTVVKGREHVPAGRACLFMANHVSNLDPPVLLSLMPPFTAIFLKQSLMRIPFLSLVMRTAGFIPVRRDGSVEAAKVSLRAARKALDEGRSIVVFPEGTRSADGRLLPFKKGPFHLAMEANAAIVPVTVRGTAALMPKGSLRVRKGVAQVEFHPALEAGKFGSRDELIAAVREGIESGLSDETHRAEASTRL